MEDDVKEADTRDGYDRWAAGYDAYDNPLIKLEQPVVRALIGECAGLDVADIGCGTGRHARWLVDRGARVTGVDFSVGMLDVLRDKCAPGALRLIEHDLTQDIPLSADAFDLVTCCLVLEHVADLDRIVSELGRICRPGGRVVISDFHPEMIRRGFHARFRDEEGGQKYQIKGATHLVSDYVMAAVHAGLQLEHISEHVATAESIPGSDSAKKWFGLPLLLVLVLGKP